VSDPVRWGLLSTAAIGSVVIAANRDSATTRFVAVASRDGVRAQEYAAAHRLPLAFPTYQALLDSPEVDAVYVALPVAMHAEWSAAALRAGKHVLCEKPFSLDPAEVAGAFDATTDRLCVEGLMWRQHPRTLLARKLLADGAIGTLRLVRAALTVTAEPGDIRRSAALGGGAIGDLGCYCVSALRLFGGEPTRLYAEAVPDVAGDVPDLRLAATLRLPGGVLGQLDIGLDQVRRDELELVGSEGRLVLPDPWICRDGTVELTRDGRTERLPADPGGAPGLRHGEGDVYRIEFDAVSTAIRTGTPWPYGKDDAVAQARVLAALHESISSGRPVELSTVDSAGRP
jgi:D-xylose 1-dehydrogenase (NADP+, D-xylono-1,5-lactone-forming)